MNRLGFSRDIKKYYYYAGVTNVIGLGNFSEGIYYFNQALGTDLGKEDFFDILAMNGIGIAYNMANDHEKALSYYEKSMVELEHFLSTVVTIKNMLEIIKIYYNTAEFYSKIKKYNQVLNLCSIGIQLLQNKNLSFCLDLLLYEKAFNLLQLDRRVEAEKFY